MRYKRVLLIKPAYKGSYYGALHPFVGIGYIGESLARHGIEYDVVDMSLKYNVRHLMKKIRAFEPLLIGVTMMSFMYSHTYRIIRQIKQVYPNISVVIGGAHASTYREKVLESVAEIDYAVTLEGEKTIVELCAGDRLVDIKGLVYRDNGKIVYNGDRKFIKDLDTIPFPRLPKTRFSAGTDNSKRCFVLVKPRLDFSSINIFRVPFISLPSPYQRIRTLSFLKSPERDRSC